SNPAPLGNSGFAVSTFVSSLHTGAIGIASGAPPNIVVGLALFYGGMAQILAGAWSFASNNAFGAVVFTSYGCYWMSYAAILIPAFGISDMLNNIGAGVRAQSLGIFYLVWAIQTFIFLLGASRSNWGTFALLLFLFVTNLLTCIGDWMQSESVLHASGYVGMFTALIAWYNVAADMLTKET
ncbi:GPR1/FUN34/yaaH family-domain-containing protein, partial [Coemansia spiralis]